LKIGESRPRAESEEVSVNTGINLVLSQDSKPMTNNLSNDATSSLSKDTTGTGGGIHFMSDIATTGNEVVEITDTETDLDLASSTDSVPITTSVGKGRPSMVVTSPRANANADPTPIGCDTNILHRTVAHTETKCSKLYSHQCVICGTPFNRKGRGHVWQAHGISGKEYTDLFDSCLVCGLNVKLHCIDISCHLAEKHVGMGVDEYAKLFVKSSGTGFTNISTIFLSFFYLFSKLLLNCF
jgi:hypothetical protein